MCIALFGMDGIDGDDRATHFIQSDDDDESTSTDGRQLVTACASYNAFMYVNT